MPSLLETLPLPWPSSFRSFVARASRRHPPTLLAIGRVLVAAATGVAIALLAWFPGHWLLALLALPATWAITRRRSSAAAVWVGYYLACARDIPLASERFFAGHGELSPSTASELGVALWLLQAIALSAPWALMKPSNARAGHAWQAVLATVLTCIPPLGIIGWVSPLHVASALFPGWQLAGLLLGLATIAVVASVPRRPRATLLAAPLVVTALLAHVYEREQSLPVGWTAMSSRFGKLDQSQYGTLFARSQNAMIAAQAAFGSGARVVILPEEIVGLWRPATRFWWAPYVATLAAQRVTLVLGVDLFPGTGGADTVNLDEHIRYTDSALILGSNPGRFDSRQPVPGGLWRPGARVSAELGSLMQRYVIIDGKRVAFSLCYEDYLLWPHWRAFFDRPDVLVSMANDWFAHDLALAHIQRQSVQSIARLADAPLLRAVNR